jgi:nicotinamide-nucleotide amidase
MKISILSIGDEICIGQVVNTNAAWIAEEFTKQGASIIFHSIIPDNFSFIKSEIYRLWDFSDVIISTGGLGPTHDDITKKALTELFNDKLEFNTKAYAQLEEFFKKRNKKITKRNKEQAMLPSKCEAIINPVGTASGMKFKRKGKLLYALPGVPSEMRAIINESIMNELLPKIKNDINRYYKTFHTAGIAEAPLADLLDVENTFEKNVSIAFLPNLRGVRLRFGIEATKDEDVAKIFANVKQKLHIKIDDYLVGEDDIDITKAVHNLITEKKKTVAVAESCTAGLLGAEFTKLPGSSAFFKGGYQVYSNESKIEVLGVSGKTIEKHGAVSEKTAIEMAEKAKKKFNSDFGISVTGIAGPEGGTDEKPVGTVWIAIADKKETVARKYNFGSTRDKNRELSVSYALYMLYKKLKDV